MTWVELDRRAAAFARSLASRRISPKDRVALLVPNRWEFVVAFLGILKLGATPAPLNPSLKKEEVAKLLGDLRAALVVESIEGGDGAWSTHRSPLSPGLILYTSGSTGQPKGAVFSHKSLSFANRSWGGPVMSLTPQDVVLAVLPFAHSFGLNGGLLAPLLCGSTVALVERFSPEAVLEALEGQHVTVFPGVATMFRRILDFPALPTANLSTLRLAVSGAAPCSWGLCREWRERTGIRVLRGYGVTELFRPISYLANDPRDFPDAVGRAVPDVEIRLVDEEGRSVPPGEVGELWIQSPAAMHEYLGDPEETRAVLRNGWFKSGDLATLSPEGFVRIVGRKRERILRGGYSVFPQEVEAVLLSHPAVAEAAVTGITSPDLGEEVAAFVTLKPGAQAAAEELIAYCKEHLAHFKYPRCVTIVSELPKGPTGKVLKSALTHA